MGRTSRSFWMNSFQYQMQSVEKKIRLQRRQFQKIGIFYLRNGILSTVKEDEVMNDVEKKTCGSVIFYFLRTLLMFVQRHFWGMKIVLFKYNCFNILSLMGADNLTVGKAFLKNKHRTTNKPLMFVLKRNQMCIVMLYCIISPLWRIKENSRIYWK